MRYLSSTDCAEISSAKLRGCPEQIIYLVTDPNHLNNSPAGGVGLAHCLRCPAMQEWNDMNGF